MVEHLREEQIFAVLLGEDLDAGARAHLAICDICGQEVASLQGGLDEFNSLGAKWAAIEAPKAVPLPSRWIFRSGLKTALTWSASTLATCALIIACLPSLHSTHSLGRTPAQAEPSAAEIQRDNQWLEAMDRDLRYSPDAIGVSARDLAHDSLHGKRTDGKVIAD